MTKRFLCLLLLIFMVECAFAQTPLTVLDDTERENLEQIIEYVDNRAEYIRRTWNIPGMAVCIVINGRVIYKRSFGVRNINEPEKVNNDTIFQIGSCSKGFTAILSAMLVDKSYFDWTDRVVSLLPGFNFSTQKLSNEITYADLLGQRSGLVAYALHSTLLFAYPKNDIVYALRYVRPAGQTGKTYAYQNVTYLLAGEVIAYRTGASWEANMKVRLLSPLGMRSTTVDYNSYIRSPNRTVGHYYSGGKLMPMSDRLPYNVWPYVFAPAGGINTNINDMSLWLQFLLNGGMVGKKRLVSRHNFNKVFERGVTVSKDAFYALGWRERTHNGRRVFWHAGTTDTEGAYVSFMPDDGIGIVVLMNLNNTSAADALTREIYDVYLRRYPANWNAKNLERAENRGQARASAQAQAKRGAVTQAPLPLSQYIGTYMNDMYGQAVIKYENGELLFSAGPLKTWLTMTHFAENDFGALDMPGWRLKNPMFHFRVDDKGNVQGLFVDQMTDGGNGFFRKVK